ncbi:hypothetical protein BW737_008405 [Actinomyces ruminis]|uniref:Uncharacterized protein n=1 Tax=Actinomyces ruminis TaxID=1937003 RepID=A0ABX4MAN6_9ACTO|nr:hypothetical protein BW737_008405 [Actinomyces ruminis]
MCASVDCSGLSFHESSLTLPGRADASRLFELIPCGFHKSEAVILKALSNGSYDGSEVIEFSKNLIERDLSGKVSSRTCKIRSESKFLEADCMFVPFMLIDESREYFTCLVELEGQRSVVDKFLEASRYVGERYCSPRLARIQSMMLGTVRWRLVALRKSVRKSALSRTGFQMEVASVGYRGSTTSPCTLVVAIGRFVALSV